jgi:hypothetical protein
LLLLLFSAQRGETVKEQLAKIGQGDGVLAGDAFARDSFSDGSRNPSSTWVYEATRSMRHPPAKLNQQMVSASDAREGWFILPRHFLQAYNPCYSWP